MKSKKVLVLTTGGTIEKSYSEDDGSIKNRESIFKSKLLSRLRLPHTDVEVHEIMNKDSLEMTDSDRSEILKSLQKFLTPESSIVVLHGTDTMEKTINYCFENTPTPPCAVVFTGAMKPAGFDDSDAQQNFTEALYAAQITEPGFYISFHSQLIPAPNAVKDKNSRTFVEK